MIFTMDLLNKHPTYREALKTFLEHPCVKDGVLCEYGSPVKGELDFASWMKRVMHVDDDRICVRLTNPVWEDISVSFTAEPYGPFAETFMALRECGARFAISTRKLEGQGGEVRQVYALDMIDYRRHIDHQPQ
jgi:hypothetical protein